MLNLFYGQAQDCNFTLSGNVFDETSLTPLSYVHIHIQEDNKHAITDNQGNFTVEGLCPGHYHLQLSHIGCQTKRVHLDFSQDTIIRISLPHTASLLGTVVVTGQSENNIDQAKLSIDRKSLEDNSNKNLAGLLENEAGVHIIKNGSGISKPVVHGLYGNRLIILNNGIIQSGQQWGNDHSPEIDPFAADKITVLKGASAIEHGGGNLGSVVLVEPKHITQEPHLHGQINYNFESNGLGHVLNTRMEQYTPLVAYRLTATFKKYGDRKTPDYFLNNTGTEEINFSIQLEKKLNEKLFSEFYFSSFNTRLGILRGSHIGNLTDLDLALQADIPLFTEPDFSYSIDAPKQEVLHQLAKAKVKYYFNDEQKLEFVLAGQINDRKEFDIRRGNRTEIPALSLLQFTLNTDLKYSQLFENDWALNIGNQNIISDNTNNPETGILPLIPDYRTYKTGFYSTLSKTLNNAEFNLGLRYDFVHQLALTFSNTLPREVIRYNNNFSNLSALLGAKYNFENYQTLSYNLGFSSRNPAINELYSNGLHQGVSGIEEGDINLSSESAIKNTIEYKWFPNTNFTFNALVYHQLINDYIFLNPTDEIRLTIRGAFPVFRYEQTNAAIYGLDLSSQFTISNSLLGTLKYSYLKGDDLTNNQPLVFMPPNSFFGSLSYQPTGDIELNTKLRLEETALEVNYRLVSQQGHILVDQDFVAPPSGYNLLGLKISSNMITPRHKVRYFIKVDNLLNESYRDYLNRQRYFADDLGMSITTGVNFKF